MREPYICPDCNHRSTRWWNLQIHMKRKHGGFLTGRSSGRFMANNHHKSVWDMAEFSDESAFQVEI